MTNLKHILFFGDSLTAGYGLSNAGKESYPALIQQKIDTEKWPYTITNAGISGDTSAGGLARIDYWTSRPVDVFVLELGINDIMRGVPMATTFKNLQAIIEKVRSRYPNAKLVLMGMQLPGFVPGVMATEFHSGFSKLATAYQMTFVPFFLEGVMGVSHLNLGDGLHPSAKGYQVIAEKVWPVIRPLLVV